MAPAHSRSQTLKNSMLYGYIAQRKHTFMHFLEEREFTKKGNDVIEAIPKEQRQNLHHIKTIVTTWERAHMGTGNGTSVIRSPARCITCSNGHRICVTPGMHSIL